jgi:uncharacterized repeat protein (TIGR02543 family)
MPYLYQSKSSAFHAQSKSLRTQALTLLLCIFFVGVSWGQVIAGWDFENGSFPGGTNNFGPSPAVPNTISSNCSVVGLTRSLFTTTGSSGAANAWGGIGNGVVTFSVTANSGYQLSITQIGAYNVRRSSAGATTGQWSYSLDGVNFTNIGSPISWGATTSAAGNSQSQIALSAISQLQNVSSSVTITFKLTNSGATTGTWYLNKYQTGDDFFIIGTVSSTSSSVTFNSNGGTGSMSNQTANTATALTSNSFTRPGYTFAGWNTAANGSGTAYADGASYSFSSSTTLYAQWTCNSGTYTGATGGNWSLGSNWCGGSVPMSASNVTIPSGVSVTLDAASTTIADLTINGTLTVAAANQLTVTGTLTNSGTLTLENGATLVQTGSNANAGSGGTYNVKQVISGSNSGGTPNGRGWYMGSPVSGATTDLFAPSNSTNLIYHWNANQTTPSWAQHAAGSAATLEVGKGYAVRVGETSPTITFSSSTLNNAPTPIAIPCYKQASTTYQGYNLVSNPFASYLDWDDAWTGTNASNFESTIYYRVANGSNVMVFDTYNAQNGQGTSNSTAGSYATRYIPPMQAFWVKMASSVPASTSAVNLSLSNSMRDHYTSVVNGWSAGLKTTAQDFPMFLRLNLEQGSFKDQMLVFLKQQASSQYDGYDSEKMFLAGYPQIYTQIGNRKLVFNGLSCNKKITVIPVCITVPAGGQYTLRAEEFNVDNGLILLEDRQEGITQDLTINDSYVFYADAGTITNRFYIKFNQLDPSITSIDPNNNWVDDQHVISEGGSILVSSNGRGRVIIHQDVDANTSDNSSVIIRDAAGREVLRSKLSGMESVYQIDVPSGIYFVEVELNGQVEVKKIFVQQ